MAFIQNKDLSLIIKNASCNRQIQSRENPSQGAEMPQAKYQTPSIQGLHCILESLPRVSQSFPPHEGSLRNATANRISRTKMKESIISWIWTNDTSTCTHLAQPSSGI